MPNSAIQVRYSSSFLKDIKHLGKHYKNVRNDLEPILEELQKGETLGDRIPNLEAIVYKARIRNRDAKKGKRGGYRLIYYLVTLEKIILLTIYSKSEQPDISINEIKQLITEAEDE